MRKSVDVSAYLAFSVLLSAAAAQARIPGAYTLGTVLTFVWVFSMAVAVVDLARTGYRKLQERREVAKSIRNGEKWSTQSHSGS